MLVGHDWGAGIALTWAGANPDEVAGFATMEGAMPPVYPRPAYGEMPERIAGMFRSMRGPDAEANVLEGNLWLDTIMPTMSESPLPDAVVAEYRRPFPTPGSRRPILEMSRTLPIGGEPANVVAAYEAGVDWWTSSAVPKLVIYAEPGRLYGPELAAWNEDEAPNATLRSVGPGRHTLQEESPEAVADALAPWLASLTEDEEVGTRAIDLDGGRVRAEPRDRGRGDRRAVRLALGAGAVRDARPRRGRRARAAARAPEPADHVGDLGHRVGRHGRDVRRGGARGLPGGNVLRDARELAALHHGEDRRVLDPGPRLGAERHDDRGPRHGPVRRRARRVASAPPGAFSA